MPVKNVLILTYGSRGDVEPFIALALGMQAAGYTVSLATAERFGDWVEGFGIPFHTITDAALRPDRYAGREDHDRRHRR